MVMGSEASSKGASLLLAAAAALVALAMA